MTPGEYPHLVMSVPRELSKDWMALSRAALMTSGFVRVPK